jgi:hypothetical protein
MAAQRLRGADKELTVADGGGGAVVGGVAFDAVAGDEFELGAEFENKDFAARPDSNDGRRRQVLAIRLSVGEGAASRTASEARVAVKWSAQSSVRRVAGVW